MFFFFRIRSFFFLLCVIPILWEPSLMFFFFRPSVYTIRISRVLWSLIITLLYPEAWNYITQSRSSLYIPNGWQGLLLWFPVSQKKNKKVKKTKNHSTKPRMASPHSRNWQRLTVVYITLWFLRLFFSGCPAFEHVGPAY